MPEYTVPSGPPPQRQRQNRSYWPELLEEVRSAKGAWRRSAKPMKVTTARQIASDLRNAHHRDPKKMRVRGTLPGEVWESYWGHDATDPDPSHAYLWLRHVPKRTKR